MKLKIQKYESKYFATCITLIRQIGRHMLKVKEGEIKKNLCHKNTNYTFHTNDKSVNISQPLKIRKEYRENLMFRQIANL